MFYDRRLYSRDPDVLEQWSFPVGLSSLVLPESGYIIGKLHLAESKYLADCGAKKPHTVHLQFMYMISLQREFKNQK
jgi:hypothetical protein